MSTVSSAFFLIITGFLAFNASLSVGKMLEVIHAFCFLFHIVPFGIAYGGGSEVYIALYYTVMWLVIAFAIYFLSQLVRPVKKSVRKRNRDQSLIPH